MKSYNLTPLVRWACRLSAVAVVVLAVAGMSCSTNGEAETGTAPTKAGPPGKPVVAQVWIVEGRSPFFNTTPGAVAAAAKGDLTGLFPDVGDADLGALLGAAEKEGEIKILLAPVILTRTGEEFSSRSGLQIPVQTMVREGLNIQYVDATVRLEGIVTQRSDGLLDAELSFKKQIPRYDLADENIAASPIHTTDSSAKVVVAPGGTAVVSGTRMISGLYATDRQKPEVSVSGELVLFITATLVDL
jgi:type II secretory pathway component HofQ